CRMHEAGRLMPNIRDLYDELAGVIHANGAWVTSTPGAPTLRFECLLQSDLPLKLRGAGFKPLHIGMGTRVSPCAMVETIADAPTRKRTLAHAGFLPVEIFDVKLGSGGLA